MAIPVVLLIAVAIPIAALLAFILGVTVIGWVRSLLGLDRERIARWEAAARRDPADPEGLPPVVRMIERDLSIAVAAAGTCLVNRRVGTTPDGLVHAPYITKESWVLCEIAGAGVTVSIASDMVTVNEHRLEAQEYATPEAFSAAATAGAMRVVKGQPFVTDEYAALVRIIGAIILAASLLWLILKLPAPAFVPK